DAARADRSGCAPLEAPPACPPARRAARTASRTHTARRKAREPAGADSAWTPRETGEGDGRRIVAEDREPLAEGSRIRPRSLPRSHHEAEHPAGAPLSPTVREEALGVARGAVG